MKSLRYLYITALLSSGASLFAEGEVVSSENTETTASALVIEGGVRDAYAVFPSEYDANGLKPVPAYFLKMSAEKQLLRLKGEYKKGLNLATHHMVALFNHDSEKAIEAFVQLDATTQSEILLCAGQTFIKDYLVALSEGSKTWYCLTEKKAYYDSDFKRESKTLMSGPNDKCTVEDGARLRRSVVSESETAKVLAWIQNVNRYELIKSDSKEAALLYTIDMLFRYASDKKISNASEEDRIEAMADYLAEIFNAVEGEEEKDSENDNEEAVLALETILIKGDWGSTQSAGWNADRNISDSECNKIKKDMDACYLGSCREPLEEEFSKNGCDKPAKMKTAATLQLNYLHALMRKLDNANRVDLITRINEKGGLKSILNKEICLSAEEDYFPFVEEDLLEAMFEICEKYMYADDVIEALNNEGQYLAIGN